MTMPTKRCNFCRFIVLFLSATLILREIKGEKVLTNCIFRYASHIASALIFPPFA